MKKLISALLCLAMLFSLTLPTFAADSNIDGGGGGMGGGTGSNSWTPGRDGVRVTIIRDSDNSPVSPSVDFANGSNGDIKIHFGAVSKISYKSSGLTPHGGAYYSIKPSAAMPRIVSSSGGNNIAAIRSYFTDKGTIQFIATQTGFDYDKLVSGDYKLLLEPVAFFKFNSVMYAMTATEAALLDQVKGGGLRNKMVSLSHKNLPLAMFLETGDLGFPAWGGSTGMINPLQVRPSPRDDEQEKEADRLYRDEGYGMNDLALHMKNLEIFFSLYIPSLTDMHKAVLKKCLVELYRQFNITWDTDIAGLSPQDFSTFADLYKLVKQKADTEQDRQAYADLALLLCDIAEGFDSFIWNRHSTITSDSQFIVLDTNALQETSDSIKRTQYFNILTYCWEQMSKDRNEKVLLVCDEAYRVATSCYTNSVWENPVQR